MTDRKLAVAYIRCSVDKSEVSPDAQLASIQDWCAAQGFVLIAHFCDIGVSGGAELDDRPGLMQALDAIRLHSAAVLIATKRDRIARDVILAAMIERLVQRDGAAVRTVQGAGDGDSPEDLLMRRLLDAFSEYERAVIRARTKTALRHKRRKGEFTGGRGAPYGFRLVPTGQTKQSGQPLIGLEADEAEQAGLRLAYWLLHEGWRPASIGRLLVQKGVRPRTGGAVWHPQSLRSFLAAAKELCHEAA